VSAGARRPPPALAAAVAAVCCATWAGAAVAGAVPPNPIPASGAIAPGASALGFAFGRFDLAHALDAAVAASPDVRAAQAVVAENLATLGGAAASFGPALVANYVLAPQGGTLAGIGDGTIASRLTTIALQENLSDLIARGANVQAARASLQASRATADVAVRTERARASGAYYDALRTQAVRVARESALALARELRDSAAARVRAGDAPRLDVLRGDLGVARAEAALALARAAEANARAALAVETGVPARELDVVVVAAPVEVPERLLDPEAAAQRAIAQRSEVRAASANVDAARANVAVAGFARYPALTASYGYTTGVDGGVRIGGPSLALGAAVPLTGASAAVVRTKNALAAESEARAEGAARAVRLSAAAAARDLAAQRAALAAARVASRAATDELRALRIGYAAGASGALDLSTARDAGVQARVDEIGAVYAEAAARATLLLEVGP